MASQITTDGTTTTLKNNGNTYLSVDTNDVVAFAVTGAKVNSLAIKTAGKESIWIPSGAMYPSTTNGCAAIAQVETVALRPDLKVDIIGARCGEKMHEKMITEEDLNRTVTRYGLDYYIIDMSSDRNLDGDIVSWKNYTSDIVDTFSVEDFLFKLKGSIINKS